MSDDGKIALTVNGEIYNHLALRASLAPEVTFKTHSDCEIILPLVRGLTAALFLSRLTQVSVQET